MPLSLCTVTGTAYTVDGDPVEGVPFTVSSAIKPGALISTADKIFTTDADGIVTMELPRGAVVTITAPIEGLSTPQTFTVPNAAAADLEALVSPTFPITEEGFQFVALGDAPASYEGQGGRAVAVKGDESGLEFVSPGLGVLASLPGAEPKSLFSNPGSGDVDIYTVPAGKRLLIYHSLVYNTSGASITWKIHAKVGGTYFRVAGGFISGAASQGATSAHSYVFEAGEIVSINATGAGLNAWFKAVEFDDTAALRSAKVTAPVTGDNTVYTAPAGKAAVVLTQNMSGSNTQGGYFVANDSGGAINAIWYAVPSGGSKGSTNQFIVSTGVGNGFVNNMTGPGVLTAGDSALVNLSAGAGVWAYVTVFEY